MFVPSPCQMTTNRRNSCASRIITGSVSGSRKRVPTRLRIATWDIGEDKSFADDLNKKQSIVSSRVALLLRSAEIKLLFHRFVLLWTFLPPFLGISWGFAAIWTFPLWDLMVGCLLLYCWVVVVGGGGCFRGIIIQSGRWAWVFFSG